MAKETSISVNRRIAKNTIYLYIRMLVILGVTLYTSRVILKSLGIYDFGIYNIVGGVVILFSFVSTSLRSATQRFVSFELGKKNNGDVNRIYSVSMMCHFLMALIVFVLAESIGLWFVENKLNIPENRSFASVCVYQFTILTFLANVFQAPYHAIIIAYERMSFYAYSSILDVFLKLVVAFLIFISPWDKLIVYSLLLLLVSFLSLIIPLLYCKYKLKVGRLKLVKEKKIYGQIMGYSGWTMFTGCVVLVTQQGGNILLNLFNGVAANGAFGIANQVSSAIYGFVSNFQSAFQPQIVKQYAAHDNSNLYNLIGRSSVFSYYLLLLIAVPFCISTEYILTLWLGINPEFAAGFCRLLILYFLCDALQAPLWMLIGAKGELRKYTIWTSALMLLNIPFSWWLLSIGCPVYVVFFVRVVLNFITCIIRPIYVRYLIVEFSLRNYIKAIYRSFFVTLLLITAYLACKNIINVLHPIVNIVVSFLFTVVIIWIVGLKKDEKKRINNILLRKISINRHE